MSSSLLCQEMSTTTLNVYLLNRPHGKPHSLDSLLHHHFGLSESTFVLSTLETSFCAVLLPELPQRVWGNAQKPKNRVQDRGVGLLSGVHFGPGGVMSTGPEKLEGLTMDHGGHDGPNATQHGPLLKQMSEYGFKPASNFILPDPTYPIPTDPKKKSHARKQPAGHIPRPKNAFILFRCDFVRQKKIPESVENDHRNISRIIGKIWRQMSDEQKEPWKKMADQEKVKHHTNYPNYKFATGPSTRKKIKRGDDVPREVQKDLSPKLEEDIGKLHQRAESCPPGDILVPQAIIENNKPAYGDPLTTRDDLSRRPSCVKFYRSTPYDLHADGQSVGYFENLLHQHYFTQALASGASIPTLDKQERIETSDRNTMFHGPRLDAVQYPIPDSTTPPEWEARTLPLDFDSLYEADYSRSSNQSADFNFFHASDPSFTDPFNPVLTALPHLPRLSHHDAHSLHPLKSSELYGHADGGHGHPDMNITTHNDHALLQGESDETASELADDMISQFTRNLHMAPSLDGKNF